MIAVLSTGTHLAVLQLVANGCMVVRYSQKEGVEEGVRKALDGQHPCDMCRLISKAKSAESSESEGLLKEVPVFKFRLLALERFVITPPVPRFQKVSHDRETYSSWSDDLLVPPPRFS